MTSPPERRRRPWAALLGLGLVAAVTLAAWVVLVYAAIEFGSDARGGDSFAWVLLAVTALGAVACLVMTLVVGLRMLTLLRDTEPARAKGGGHRAAR